MFSAKLQINCLLRVVICVFVKKNWRLLFVSANCFYLCSNEKVFDKEQIQLEMSHIDIFEATSCESRYVSAINRLLGQLCSSPCEISEEQLLQIIDEPNSRLLLLTIDSEVIGMCTIGFYTSPTGRKAWIEDVVVDTQCRGQHLGEYLVNYAVSFAEREGFDTLMLTSRPSRVAANRLYQKVGFNRRETNVYVNKKA